ncbi:MAG: aldehyde dehydrogenase family protein [Sphingomonadales bacterium]|nr:aldehyde dehydrogenase family protein [Sphingomonadales bacterium]
MPSFKLLIDGVLVKTDAELDVVNPATGELLARCPRANEADLNRAVKAANIAFPAWSRRTIEDRAALLVALADALDARASEFARLLTEEQGKPLDQAGFEIGGASYVIRTFAGMRLPPETLRDNEQGRVVEYRVPLGTVAAITPWNFPVLLLMNKLAPALLAGNTIVVKPAPTTPLTTLLFGELCAAILPAGVVNIIVDANDLGALLTSHPGIAKIAFTGSTATGKKVMASASESVKRVTLELGGNDGAIVLDDVEAISAAKHLFDGAMLNAGQICVAIKRAYVPSSMYDAVCEELVRLANEAVVDNGMHQGTQIGPVQNATQFAKLKDFLVDAAEHGTIIAGGHALDRPGYFIAPTIVRDVSDDARIVREEQFGPILPVLSYDHVEDVITRINDSDYGLAGTVWGKDLDRANAVASRIDAGTIWVNQHLAIDATIPFRGAKQSGFGGELGLEGLKEYTQARIVNSVPLV